MGYDKTHKDLSKIIAVWGNVNISCDAYQLSQSKQVGASTLLCMSVSSYRACTVYCSVTSLQAFAIHSCLQE